MTNCGPNFTIQKAHVVVLVVFVIVAVVAVVVAVVVVLLGFPCMNEWPPTLVSPLCGFYRPLCDLLPHSRYNFPPALIL